jgi:hypothetical protein
MEKINTNKLLEKLFFIVFGLTAVACANKELILESIICIIAMLWRWDKL